MTIDIYWHICQLSNWKRIIEEQYKTISDSGLIEKCDNIYIGFLGKDVNDINFLTQRSNKIKIFAFSKFKEHCERLTLNAMREHVIRSNEESYILYIHSKGVTRDPDDKGIKLWREVMQYFLIEKYELCLKLLETGAQTVGVNAINSGNMKQKIDDESHCCCYSGNFWWSSSKHIANLPMIPETPKNMIPDNFFWLCERWLMCKSGTFIEIYNSGFPHFYGILPENVGDYKKKLYFRYLQLDRNKTIMRVPFRILDI